MGTKSDRNIFRTLHNETARAVRRGEKFARSLKRVVAQRTPDTVLQPLLQAVEKGLVTLSAEADDFGRIGWPKKEAGRNHGKSKPTTATPTGDAKAKAVSKSPNTRAKGSGLKTGDQPQLA